MEAHGKAITARPPFGAATAHPRRVVATSISPASSAAALAVVGTFADNMGDWVTFTSDVNCFIAFGASAAMPAATTGDWPLQAGTPQSWWITPNDCYFRVVTAAGTGVLKRALSS